MAPQEPRLYGVSFGDGNNGVSHLYPEFYVRTADPWTLARVATLAQFKAGAGQAWAARHVDVDGEADFTVQAVLYNPPCEATTDGEYPELEDDSEAEDGRNWSDHNGAWMLCDVFAEEDPREGRPIYASLADAFTPEILALVAK